MNCNIFIAKINKYIPIQQLAEIPELFELPQAVNMKLEEMDQTVL